MKTKNSLLVSALCLLMIVFCVVGLTSCGEDKECSHQWGDWSATTNATCTEPGTQERKCSECGKTETSDIEALGHDWNEATCSTPKTCKICSATEGTVSTHAFTVEEVKDEALKSAATCTGAAVYYKSCACGSISTEDTFTSGDVSSHSFTLEEVKDEALKSAATCTGAAVYYKSCDCGEISAEDTFTSGDPIAHSFTLETVTPEALKSAATATSAAVYFKSCACGAISTNVNETFENGSPVVGGGSAPSVHSHSFTVKAATAEALKTPATCTSAAVYYKSCVCGTVSTNSEETFTDGSPLEHKDENNDHNCDVCEATNISEHSFGQATCGAPAICTVCGARGETVLEHKDENLDHVCDNGCGKNDMGTHADSDADDDHACDYGCGALLESCSDVETDADHKCDVCGKDNVSAHNYVAGASTDATCSDAATQTYECNCGDSYTENNGDALGHNITNVSPVSRQVVDCEYVLVYTCTVCSEEVLDETVYNHNYVASISSPATCATPGEKTFKCNVCGNEDKEPEEIPADETGHNWVQGTVDNGTRTDTCSICSTTKDVTVYTGTVTDEIRAEDLANKEIELNDANISLDSGVIDTIGDQSITVSADKVEGDDRGSLGLNIDQLAQVGDNPIYNFTINNGSENISNFGEENWVTITLPYTLSENEDVDTIAVWFINDSGELESIKATYNNGFVTFKTNHFSYYTVTRLTPAERCALYSHAYVSQHVEGSCTKDTYDLYVCVRCHDTYTDTLVVADGHDYESETVDATCTEAGNTVYTCKDCGHSYTTRINALGHSWSVVESVESTCAVNGYTKYGCDNCDEEYTITYAKLAHVYTDSTVPATCTDDGYALHDCDNCEYSYKDNYVAALGHTYGEGVWQWAEDYSAATLKFTCENDEEHVLTFDASIEADVESLACCDYVKASYTATVVNKDTTYTDEKTVETGTVNHTFSSDWSTDNNAHWHECICGEKNDVANHLFENATVTKAPTCVNNGESTAYCECGKTKVSAIPATGEHNYMNGVCADCGNTYGSCDHTDTHKAFIDLGELGACEGLLEYFTCDCGEFKFLDGSSDISCSFEMFDGSEYIDENGNYVEIGKGICDCGFEMHASAVVSISNCIIHASISYEFFFDGEPVIELDYEDRGVDHATPVINSIDLSDYGTCGGTLYVEQCPDCETIFSIDDIEIDCDLDLSLSSEPEEVLDENGNVHYIYLAVCPDCGFSVECDFCEEYLSVCETRYTVNYLISCNETVIVNFSDLRFSSSHNYETTYELLGETCEDGAIVTETCSVCNDSYSYTTTGHLYEYYVQLDGSGYEFCDVEVSCDRCVTCGHISWSNVSVNCPNAEWDYQPITDEQGNEIGYVQTCSCPDCGLYFIQEANYESVSGCEVYTCEENYIYKNDVCVWSYQETYTEYIHQYEATYELLGKTCEDGVIVTQTCSLCNESISYTITRHMYEHNAQIDLSEYDFCDVEVTCTRCVACGYILWFNVYFNCPNAEWDQQSFTDEQGNEIGFVQTCSCPDCGLEFIKEANYESVSGCDFYGYEESSLYKNDTCIFSAKNTFVQTRHQFDEISYELLGETCEDGVIVTQICSLCNESDSYTKYSHLDLEFDVQIDLSEYDFCDVAVGCDRCVTCGHISWSNVSVNCPNAEWDQQSFTDEQGNEIGYVQTCSCPDCGLEFIETTNYEPVSGCKFYGYEESSLYKNDTCIFSAKNTFIQTRHQYETTYELLGETCEDGVKVIQICSLCNESDSYTEYSHLDLEFDVQIDLSEYDFCDVAVTCTRCVACSYISWYNVNVNCPNAEWDHQFFTDEQGNEIGYVQTCSCPDCGLEFIETTNYEPVSGCKFYGYEESSLYKNDTCIFSAKNTFIQTRHQYETTYELLGETCEDGVKVIRICKNCDSSTISQVNDHRTYVKETIDLSDYGCVCGGSALVHGCACGRHTYVSLDNCLCDFGTKTLPSWIESDVSEGQYTINGWNSFDSYAQLYTCAVTDPAERACAFKIRCAAYWLKGDDCMVYQYQTWQFGYNEETDTCLYEITFKTGSQDLHHNYVDTGDDNNVKLDCPDCESYYYCNKYYDENNVLYKYEEFVSNPLNNGFDKYRESVSEFDFNENQRYESSWYYKTIFANDSWEETRKEQQPYVGPFGSVGYEGTHYYSNSDSSGYTEDFAFVVFETNHYTIYCHTTYNDGTWFNNDYSYSFENGCRRTTEYEDSDGNSWTETEDFCIPVFIVSIKEPTCSQDGTQCYECTICGTQTDFSTVNALDHRWVKLRDNWYFCAGCGLENTNGVSGDIIMEDLSEAYGNGEYYVVGYSNGSNVAFTKYVSLILADETEVVITSGIEFVTIDGVRAFAFSKADVDAWATENGYTDYNVRFSFVPTTSSGSLDYAITFAESTVPTTIIDSVAFIGYVAADEGTSYTITPSEDGVWRFTSFAEYGDPIAELYNSDQEIIAFDDDSGNYWNFDFSQELTAGETYTIKISWCESAVTSGAIPLSFYKES